MSNMIACDGPGCDTLARPNRDNPELPPVGWHRVVHPVTGLVTEVRDFHSITCLGQWHYCTTTPDACK